MQKIEDLCVGCTDLGLPCLGNSCPNKNVLFYYCDECNELANYTIEESDLCEECAHKYLQEIFDGMSISEKSKILDICVEDIRGI